MKIKKHVRKKIKVGGSIGYFQITKLLYDIANGDLLSILYFILGSVVPLPASIPFFVFKDTIIFELRKYLPNNGILAPYIIDFVSNNIHRLYSIFKKVEEKEKIIGGKIKKRKNRINKNYYY